MVLGVLKGGGEKKKGCVGLGGNDSKNQQENITL